MSYSFFFFFFFFFFLMIRRPPRSTLFPYTTLSSQEGDRMCRAMGEKDILFLRNHGIIVAGPTVAQAYDDLYYLERTAMVQVLAMQTGRPLHNIDEALAEHTANQIAGEAQQAFLHFDSLKRMLDRDEPGWRTLAA